MAVKRTEIKLVASLLEQEAVGEERPPLLVEPIIDNISKMQVLGYSLGANESRWENGNQAD